MRQKLKDRDRRRKQPVAEKGGSQTRPKWAKMDGFGSKARPNLTTGFSFSCASVFMTRTSHSLISHRLVYSLLLSHR